MSEKSVKREFSCTLMQNTNEVLQAYCRNMLIATDGLVYHEPYIFHDTVSTKSLQVKGSYGAFVSELSDYIKLYPNPAKEYITIEFNLPYDTESIIAEIVNIQGKPVEIYRLSGNRGEKIVDMRKFIPGTYLVRLWANGIVLETGKFVKK